MFIFGRVYFDTIQGSKLTFYKLLVNGRCLFDEFYEEMTNDARDKKSLNSILSYMNIMAATNNKLPKEKFRHIKNVGIDNLYEFKKDRVRIYIMLEEPNVYIITGGYKVNQEKDIKSTAKIAKEYSNKENKIEWI